VRYAKVDFMSIDQGVSAQAELARLQAELTESKLKAALAEAQAEVAKLKLQALESQTQQQMAAKVPVPPPVPTPPPVAAPPVSAAAPVSAAPSAPVVNEVSVEISATPVPARKSALAASAPAASAVTASAPAASASAETLEAGPAIDTSPKATASSTATATPVKNGAAAKKNGTKNGAKTKPAVESESAGKAENTDQPESAEKSKSLKDAKASDAKADPEAAKNAAKGNEGLPRSWRQYLNLSASFTTSAMVHAGLLVAMSLWFLPQMIREEYLTITVIPERDQEEVVQELDDTIVPATELTTLTASSAESASTATSAPGNIHQVAAPTVEAAPVVEKIDGPKAILANLSHGGLTGGEANGYLGANIPGDPSAIVDSYDHAMDRITQEILMMLSQGKVLVIWNFDQSESMKDDQKEIRDRIERVYQELGLTTAAKGDALFTAVCSYGKDWMMHMKSPSANFDEIRGAIDAVPSDPSGEEIMCKAVGMAVTEYKNYAISGQRQLALILVTDESGNEKDNWENLEAAIAVAKAARCRVYVLGREAVFGYPYAHMRWTDPATKLSFWRRIDRGPETPMVETLQTNGFYRRYDAHPSGFGPYEQVRMARETGGIFFMLPSPETNLVHRDNRKYALEAMRPYLPDLSPRQEYLSARGESILRTSLWNVIVSLNPYDKNAARYIEMRHSFSITPPVFLTQVRTEQGKAKECILYMQKAQEELEKLKFRREQEPSPRWQANYDLMLAQLATYQMRLWEYGVYLENATKNPLPIKNLFGKERRTTHWDLRVSKKLVTGEDHKALMDEAIRLLKLVIVNHPGTPWSARAEWELSRGFGIELVEGYTSPSRPGGVQVKLPNL